MMRLNNIKMKTVVNKEELLAKLHTNLGNHTKELREAKKGFLVAAKEQLLRSLKGVENGEAVNISINLTLPSDYTEVYKNVIEMVKWNTQSEITLEADEFRQLVLDEWDWSANFKGLHTFYNSYNARS